jgi:WD40 repeat protein
MSANVAGLAQAVELRPALTLHGANGQIVSGRFVDDTTLVVVSGSYVHLIDAGSGRARTSVVDATRIARVVVSNDGSTFALLDRMGKLTVRRRVTFDSSDAIAPDRSFSNLAIDATGTRVVSAIGNIGAVVDLVRGDVVELIGHLAQPAQERGEIYDAARIRAVAIAGSGAIAVTGGSDGRAIVWDVASAKALHVLGGHDAEVAAVAIDPGATAVVTIDDLGSVRTWTIAGRALLQHRFASRAIALGFNRAGTTLAALLEDGTLVLLQRRGEGDDVWWQPVRTFALPKPYPYALDLSFDRSDATVAVASPRNIATGDGWLDDSAVVLVSLETRAVRDVRVAGTSVRSLIVSEAADGVTVFAADAHPASWDLAGDGQPRPSAWPPLFEAAKSPTGDTIAAIGIDGTLGLYDSAGALRHVLATAGRPATFAWSRAGDALAVAVRESDRDVLRIFGTDGGESASFAVDRGTLALAFSPTGSLVVASGTSIVSYDPRAWKATWRIARPVNACAFAQAGVDFFVAYSSDPIVIYDFIGGKPLGTLDDGRVSGTIATDATGELLVTTGYDGCRLWSVRRMRVVARFDGLLGGDLVERATFTHDASRVIFNVGNERYGGCMTVFDVGDFQ